MQISAVATPNREKPKEKEEEDCILILLKYKPPSKKMQFIMKSTTLLHIDPSQVSAPNQENPIYHEVQDVIAY